jgi:DNA-binding phage protein
MALTRTFRQTVLRRAQREPAFARALLREAVQAMITGDLEAGKALARDYINATVGFERLGARLQTSPKSLMRMFSAAGNPQARNLFAVLDVLQADAGVTLRVIASGRRSSSISAIDA